MTANVVSQVLCLVVCVVMCLYSRSRIVSESVPLVGDVD